MNKKSFLGAGIAVFIAIILISSTTAIPLTNIEAVDEIGEDENFDYKIMKKNPSILEKIVYKWIGVKGVDGFIGGCEIIDECNNAYNDANVQAEIENTRIDCKDMLDGLEQKYLRIGRTFELPFIRDRIDSLSCLTVVDDVQSLLDFPTDYDEFNRTRRDAGSYFMQMAMAKNFTDLDSFYPVIDLICSWMCKISMIWTIPLAILFGMVGLLISNFITYVFFAPITVPMSLYISLSEVINGNSSMRDDMIAIMVATGLVGLCTLGLPILLKSIFMSEYGLNGFLYVFDRMSILTMNQYKNEQGYELVTGETEPEVTYITHDNIYVGEPTSFHTRCYDPDMLKWNNKKEARDHLRLAIDWKNDGDFDTISPLYRDKYGFYDFRHQFFEEGNFTAKFVVFDLMGAFSEPFYFDYKVREPKNVPVNHGIMDLLQKLRAFIKDCREYGFIHAIMNWNNRIFLC